MTLVAKMGRTILSSTFALGGFLCLVVGLASAALSIGPMIVQHDVPVHFFTRPLFVGVSILALFYGAVRVWCFHPVFDADYCLWLSRTPWTPTHSLPKGPVRLVWLDYVLLFGLGVISYVLGLTSPPSDGFTPRLFAAAPSLACALSLALGWTWANWIVRQRSHCYVVFAAPPALTALLGTPGSAWSPIVMAAIAWHGVRSSFDRFPWDERFMKAIEQQGLRRRAAQYGWPFRELIAVSDDYPVPLRKAFVEGALAGGWCWLLFRFVEESEPQADYSDAIIVLTVGAAFACIVRLTKYGCVLCEQLCWGRRAAAKSWVLWRHDQIFAAPLLMIAAGWAVPWILYNVVGLSIAFSLGLASSLVVWIGRGMGPSVQALRYTGIHSKFGRFGSPLQTTATRIESTRGR